MRLKYLRFIDWIQFSKSFSDPPKTKESILCRNQKVSGGKNFANTMNHSNCDFVIYHLDFWAKFIICIVLKIMSMSKILQSIYGWLREFTTNQKQKSINDLQIHTHQFLYICKTAKVNNNSTTQTNRNRDKWNRLNQNLTKEIGKIIVYVINCKWNME